jgi:hypothetical protein
MRKEVIGLIGEANALLKSFYELYYTFDTIKTAIYFETQKSLATRVEKAMKTKKANEIPTLRYLSSIIQMEFNLLGPLLTAEL